MKTGLVLGGGGIVGVAWLVGALQALERELGWSAGSAETIVGTSAGALVGSLVAAGVPTKRMSSETAGLPLSEMSSEEHDRSLADRLSRFELRLANFPRPWPGSLPLLLATARQPRRHSAGVVLTGWMPRGIASTAPIEELVETFAGSDWPEHSRFWSIAADYATGRRVVLGRGREPLMSFPAAVAASCATPGIFQPVATGGRLLVDGGVCSPANLDVLLASDAEIVIGLNPMSSWDVATQGTPLGRITGSLRSQAGRQLGHEARKLRAQGRQVILLQPDAGDVALMGRNYFSGRRAAGITVRARESVAMTLRTMDIPPALRRRTVTPIGIRKRRRA
jgi:NTE family protein